MYIWSSSILNWSPNLSESRINIDLEAPVVEKKIIYMVHFHPLWIENSVVTHSPLLPPKESKINWVMMSHGKNRQNLV